MSTSNRTHLTLLAALGGAALACQGPASEYQRALPDRTLVVQLPGETTASGLRAQGVKRSELVGAPAEWYSNTYYSSRDLNAMVVFVVGLVEAITDLPATVVTDHSAVWGPFSDRLEPNEWVLAVERKDSPSTHYVWKIAGRPKSGGADAYLDLVGGAFQPDGDDYGKGWFAIDFEKVRALNPSEDARGQIAFAFGKSAEGVLVAARAHVLENGADLEAGYAYGQAASGEGFILFALPVDIDHGQTGREAREAVLIRSRWNTDGEGRADILATAGDLQDTKLIGSQCWNKTFVSTYEGYWVDGALQAEDGAADSCAFKTSAGPDAAELPGDAAVTSPFPMEME